MAIITIQTEDTKFAKAIVAFCKNMGISSVSIQNGASAKPAKKLRKDIAKRIDAVYEETAELHSFNSVSDLKTTLFPAEKSQR